MKSRMLSKIVAACVAVVLASGLTVNAKSIKKDSYMEKKGVKIEYYGHSSFGISNKDGMQIVTDPYDPEVGYKFPTGINTNILTESHDHFDHNYTAALQSYNRLMLGENGKFKFGDIKVQGIASWHDPEQGTLRGPNTIYTYEINNVRICHLGDQGVELTKEQINSIGQVDILMIPVGGSFTIDEDQAIAMISELNPKVVIPMHYVTEVTNPFFAECGVVTVDSFLGKMQAKGWNINKADDLVVTKQALNTMKTRDVYVMNYNH